MSLTTEQVQELTTLINERLGEFGLGNVGSLSRGAVRLAHEVIMEWEQGQDEAVIEEYANARVEAYQRGLEHGRKEAQAKFERELAAAMESNDALRAEFLRATIAKSQAEAEADAAYERGRQAMADWFAGVDDRPADPNSATTETSSIDEATGISDDDWCGPEDDDPADLAAAWPDMPDLPDGVDRFAEYPVAGDPHDETDPATQMDYADDSIDPSDVSEEAELWRGSPPLSPVTPLVERPIGRDRTASAAHPWKSRVDGKPSNPLPTPGLPRTLEEADALKAEMGRIVEALRDMAVDGQMPKQQEWQEDRPQELPCYQTIRKHHGVESWAKLAQMAGLAAPTRGRQTDDARSEYLREYRRRIKSNGGKPLGADSHGRVNSIGKRGNELPTLEQVVAFVKQMAMGGVMPTRSQFDDARPAKWATASAHLQRLNLSWDQLRLEAELKPNPRSTAAVEA